MITEITCFSDTDCDYLFFKNDTDLTLTRDSSKVIYGNQFPKVGITFDTARIDESGNLSGNPLIAGNPASTAISLRTIIVKRQKIGDNFLKEIAEFPYDTDVDISNLITSFIDYSAVSGEQYRYYFIPKERVADGYQMGTPIPTDVISSLDWDHWTLLLGDNYINQDGKEDVSKVIVNKIFLFELNISSGQMSIGTKYSQQENFTPYPKIQRNYTHNWSGSLKGLLGMIAPNDVDFIQTPNMLQEWKNLAQNTQRKFLKDRDGNLWEIELNAAPGINNTDNLTFDLKEKTLSWTEVDRKSVV